MRLRSAIPCQNAIAVLQAIEHRTHNRLMDSFNRRPRSFQVPGAGSLSLVVARGAEISFTCNQQLRLRLGQEELNPTLDEILHCQPRIFFQQATIIPSNIRLQQPLCDNRNHGRSDRPACAQIHRLKAPRATISTRNINRPHRPHIPNPIFLTLSARSRAP